MSTPVLATGQGETEDEALHSLLDAINGIATVRLEQAFNATRTSRSDGVRVVTLQQL